MRTRVSGGAVAAGLVLTTLLMWSTMTPLNRAGAVVPTIARNSVCGAHALCPNDPAPPDPGDLGDQPTAEQRVIQGYIAKQKNCTPELTPSPQSVTWDPPGFTPNAGGSGNIKDVNPQLGGHFRADWVNGRWHIEYPYC